MSFTCANKLLQVPDHTVALLAGKQAREAASRAMHAAPHGQKMSTDVHRF
jgi:hypothetical protein